MTAKLLSGFLIKDVEDVINIETILFEMKNIVSKKASIAYEKLVKWQVERIVDEIALNQIKRPEHESIYDMATSEVRRRIIYAEKRMQQTEFNLYIGAQILIGKIDEKPVVYLKINAPNDIYSRGFQKIKELVPYDINSDDLNVKKDKYNFWNTVSEKYRDNIPLESCLIQYDTISVNTDHLQFRSPVDRANDLAKERVLNHLLASYGCDQQISPNKLMEYVLFSIDRLGYKSMQDMLEMEKEKLIHILPEITLDLILKGGCIQTASKPADEN